MKLRSRKDVIKDVLPLMTDDLLNLTADMIRGDLTIKALRQRYVRMVLNDLAGNKAAACRTLGISRPKLYAILKS